MKCCTSLWEAVLDISKTIWWNIIASLSPDRYIDNTSCNAISKVSFWAIEPLLIKFQGKKGQSIVFPLFTQFLHSWKTVRLKSRRQFFLFVGDTELGSRLASCPLQASLWLHESECGRLTLPRPPSRGVCHSGPGHRVLAMLSVHRDKRKHSLVKFPKPSLGGSTSASRTAEPSLWDRAQFHLASLRNTNAVIWLGGV